VHTLERKTRHVVAQTPIRADDHPIDVSAANGWQDLDAAHSNTLGQLATLESMPTAGRGARHGSADLAAMPAQPATENLLGVSGRSNAS
jgi:hypothetical protein